MDSGEIEGEDFDSQVTLCTNLVISNKINAKNAWDLRLIDMMGENLSHHGADVEEEHTGPVNNKFRGDQNKNQPNFQKFAHILDAASNIYATRVDDAFVRTTRFQFGLQDTGNNNPGGSGEGSSKEKRAVAAKTNASMLETNSANITKVIEKGAQIDPLYDRAVATIDMAGAKGSLLDVLMLSEGLKVMFDSQEIVIGTNLRQGVFTDEASQERFEALKEDRKSRFKDLDEYNLDNSLYQSLRGMIRPKTVDDQQVCSGYAAVKARRDYYAKHAVDVLKDYELDINIHALENGNNQIQLEQAIKQESLYDSSQSNRRQSLEENNELESLFTSAASMEDDDSDSMIMNDHPNSNPKDGFDGAMYDDDNDDPQGMLDDSGDEDTVLPSIAEGLSGMDHDMIRATMKQQQLSALYEEDSLDSRQHFTLDQLLNKSKFWSGQAVPKQKRVVAKPIDDHNENAEPATKGKRKNKSDITIDFEAAYASMLKKEDKKKPVGSISLKKREIEILKEEQELLLLPPDALYTIDMLQRPMLSTHLTIPLKPSLKLAIQSATSVSNCTLSNAFIDIRKVMGIRAATQPMEEGTDHAVTYEDTYDMDEGPEEDGMSMTFHDDPLELIASERIMTSNTMEYNTQKQTVFNIRKVKAEIVRSLVDHAEENVVLCNRANRVVYNAKDADKWDVKLGEETIDNVKAKQSLLGGNEGKMLHTDFETLVHSLYKAEVVQNAEDQPEYKRGTNPIPGCFIALLLSANEKNLELRPKQPEKGVLGKNHKEIDSSLDLGNFDIFVPFQ